ncbi:hypothetical protein HAX54_032544 [Datura stramonium]|uniref:Uncharacterized protein n=1 Tax=Datura stramonium TaxID=4076 RepID=A0ABS8VBS8_DATST|nr:hypothetical protein [Datura stramonium]
MAVKGEVVEMRKPLAWDLQGILTNLGAEFPPLDPDLSSVNISNSSATSPPTITADGVSGEVELKADEWRKPVEDFMYLIDPEYLPTFLNDFHWKDKGIQVETLALHERISS